MASSEQTTQNDRLAKRHFDLCNTPSPPVATTWQRQVKSRSQSYYLASSYHIALTTVSQYYATLFFLTISSKSCPSFQL
jgi:hypothetical protein